MVKNNNYKITTLKNIITITKTLSSSKDNSGKTLKKTITWTNTDNRLLGRQLAIEFRN